MRNLPQALAPLGQFKQWVLWIAVPDNKRPGKTNKYPINPQTGAVVTAHDPSYWMSFEEAASWMGRSQAHGVGFVFTEQDPFFFLDIDDAFDGTQWSQLSLWLCQQFQGAAVEISNSGTGLHIIGCAVSKPHGKHNKPVGLELYTEKRFVALTGRDVVGDAFQYCQGAFEQLVDNYFPPRGHDIGDELTEEPLPEWNGPTDDDELIRKAMKSSSAGATFGTKASFKDLWTGDEEKLSVAYPTLNDRDSFGWSEAEAALCTHLAFWTGKHGTRIDRLFRLSGLMREKWDRDDYSTSTILLACSGDGDVYGSGGGQDNQSGEVLPGAAVSGPVENIPVQSNVQPSSEVSVSPFVASASTDVQLSARDRFITSTELPDYFKGCVYVSQEHAILTPGGHLLDQGRFKAVYGGAIFSLDTLGDKVTRNAWEALVENISLRFPKVEKTTFAPELPPGGITDHQGTTMVNTYWPIKVERQAGDASPFINHLYKLLPNGDDAKILLSYMASMVQNPGHKFQWCPVVQGPEGNGKTIFIECLTQAVGERYTHLPKAHNLGDSGAKFNKWIDRRLFIGVEEIYCGDRREVLEILKDVVTNRRIEIQGKGADQDTGDNRTNWLMLTNHKDAIPITTDSRRYAILYCSYQTYDQMLEGGMDGEYFKTLYTWLRKQNGYAIVTDFLLNYQVEAQFDPSENGESFRAPKTSSTREAIEVSAGVIEQEVQEAVAQGRPGFCDPWISSMALDKLLKEIKRTLPNVKRPDMLRTLGYVPHPHLNEGRVNNATATDGGKTRLYCKEGHLVGQLTQPSDISKKYDADQNVNPSLAAQAFG